MFLNLSFLLILFSLALYCLSTFVFKSWLFCRWWLLHSECSCFMSNLLGSVYRPNHILCCRHMSSFSLPTYLIDFIRRVLFNRILQLVVCKHLGVNFFQFCKEIGSRATTISLCRVEEVFFLLLDEVFAQWYLRIFGLSFWFKLVGLLLRTDAVHYILINK